MTSSDQDLSAVLLPLTASPVARFTLPSALATLVDRAAPVLGARPEASVTLVRRGPGRTVAASSPAAVALDEVQYRADDGPCLAAARGGGPAALLSGDAARWPDLARALDSAGYDGVWSQPLPVDGPETGSLNLYVRRGGADGVRETATALVQRAVVPVTSVWLYEEAVRTAENLRVAMESRAVIEQAKGILMARLRLTADRAFEALARLSNDRNTKLRDVAQSVVDTGELPR